MQRPDRDADRAWPFPRHQGWVQSQRKPFCLDQGGECVLRRAASRRGFFIQRGRELLRQHRRRPRRGGQLQNHHQVFRKVPPVQVERVLLVFRKLRRTLHANARQAGGGQASRAGPRGAAAVEGLPRGEPLQQSGREHDWHGGRLLGAAAGAQAHGGRVVQGVRGGDAGLSAVGHRVQEREPPPLRGADGQVPFAGGKDEDDGGRPEHVRARLARVRGAAGRQHAALHHARVPGCKPRAQVPAKQAGALCAVRGELEHSLLEPRRCARGAACARREGQTQEVDRVLQPPQRVQPFRHHRVRHERPQDGHELVLQVPD
mmetsp:Transcript_47648/g.90933  ORF Transcript_47648/g.90933 Transcript_47648/m.90933 type:complete len:317 (+) Transcript_47648:406-1356(+)